MVNIVNLLIRFSFICSWLNIQPLWALGTTTSIPQCTSKVCEDYIDSNGCPDVSNCTGIILPSPTLCNCCKYCLDYIEEGELCSQGVPGQASIQVICGPQLTCKNNICVKMETECMKAKARFEELWKKGMLGGGEIEPLCDDVGDYGPVQCIPGSICFCSSPTGDRIFGEMVYKHADMQLRMDCACSRDEWRARNRIQSMEKKSSRQMKMKSIFARCLSTGSYDVLQCVNTRCACVDEEGVPQPQDFGKKVEYVYLPSMRDGKPWCFNLTKYEPGSFDTPCLKERGKFLDMLDQLEEVPEGKSPAIVLGSEYVTPNCAPDGSYERVQMSWDSIYCVDPDGRLLKSEKGSYSIPLYSAAAEDMDCKCARTVYLLNEWIREEAEKEQGSDNDDTPPLIVRIPLCCPNGNFARWQCDHGECHCVDSNGAQNSPNVPLDDVATLPCYIENLGQPCVPLGE